MTESGPAPTTDFMPILSNDVLRAYGLPLLVALAGALSINAAEGRPAHFSLPTESSIWAAALKSKSEFRPHPPASDRKAWSMLPEALREAYVGRAEEWLRKPWPALEFAASLEYTRTGERVRYESRYHERRRRLGDLVLAECIEHRGRFTDAIADAVWSICEESSWVPPAHRSALQIDEAALNGIAPGVDLFVAETAQQLAWTSYLLGPPLDGVAPVLRRRIVLEVERRFLAPVRNRKDFAWMGHTGREPNNWNPWIVSNWLASSLLLQESAELRAADVAAACHTLNRFIAVQRPDGGCDEGPGYWARAAGSLFDCLTVLAVASSGRYDFRSEPLVAALGSYLYRVHIADDYFVNIGDADARTKIPGDLVFRYGDRVGDKALASLGAASELRKPPRDRGASRDLGRQLDGLFDAHRLTSVAAMPLSLPRDVWMPDTQIMTARDRADSPQGFFLAAQGGHNAESHNHNDVGNFIVYHDGTPVLIDLGAPRYTAKSFSSKRYEIWVNQSAWHNVPMIGEVQQADGREFAAGNARHTADDAAAELALNLEAAYPAAAGLAAWRRTLRLERGRRVVVTDAWRFAAAPKTIAFHFLTPRKAMIEPAGTVLLAGGREGAEPLRFRYDEGQLMASLEAVTIEDARLRENWGQEITRIVFRTTGARPSGELSFVVEK